MNITVTGGAGYKGVMLVRELLKLGHRVNLIDNFMYGYQSILHLVTEPRLTIKQLDIRNLSELDVSDADVIFHLAGISGMPACAANPHSAETINVVATRNLISHLSRNQPLVFASTTSVYGVTETECNEATKITPQSLYAKTKYEAECAVMERANSIALRFATIFGTSCRMRVDLIINDFVYKAINERSLILFGSNTKRTCMHISDAISGYLFALEHYDNMCGNVFNVGDETLNYSKRDIANAIRKLITFEIVDSSMPDTDIRDFSVSFKNLRMLGYSVKYSLDDGIRELLKLYSFYKVHSHFNTI